MGESKDNRQAKLDTIKQLNNIYIITVLTIFKVNW